MTERPPPDPALLGQVLDGRYRIDALLGSGGFGAVYRATHIHLSQRVAIKLIRPHLATDPIAARRLAREAKGTFLLDTEHAVKVADFGATESGQVYLVMEYLDGRTVADELEVDGALSPARAVRIAAQVCEALAAAHRLGFVHRDIKPDNLMLIQRGGDADFVKVLDFGLAKLFGGGDGAPFSIAALTQNDMVFGTPEYIAPEQAMGKPLDGRADLYGLGATLFEMITGRPPFVEPSPMRLLAAHVRTAPPRLSSLRADVPPELDDLLARCLAKAPDARPATADGLGAEMRALAPRLATGSPRVPAALAASVTVPVPVQAPAPVPMPVPVSAPLPAAPRRTGTVIAAIGVPVVVLGALAAVALTRTPDPDEPRTASRSTSRSDAAAPTPRPPPRPLDAAPPPPPAPAVDAAAPVPHPPAHRTIPPAAAAHLAAAESARRAGNRLRQLAEADAALSADPTLTRARFLVGEALLDTGDAANGCKYLRQAHTVAEARTLVASGRCPAD